jgi:hypothetical protein
MELSNLVRKLTNSRDLDGTRPVGVHECLAEGQVLDILFRDISMGLVELHIEVSRSDAADGGLLRDHEEVIAVVVEVLNQLLVDDGTRWWVDNLSTSILTEHSLVDPLVHDDQSDLRRIHLVVLLKKSKLNLSHLLVDTMLHLLLTETISEDYDLIRQPFMVENEFIECLAEASVKVLLDNLLVLGLKDDVRVVTCELLVGCCHEAYD